MTDRFIDDLKSGKITAVIDGKAYKILPSHGQEECADCHGSGCISCAGIGQISFISALVFQEIK